MMRCRKLVIFAIVALWTAASVAPARSIDTNTNLILQVRKSEREMVLRRGDHVMRRFRVVLGSDPKDPKRRLGDGRTPEGHYRISEKMPSRKYHRFLGIDYPNYDDAEWALEQQLISGTQWADIFFAHLRGKTPPASTPLGGRVGIHGFGNRPLIPLDWTEGCIAVSNEEIDFLYDTVPVGTAVIIEQ